MVGVQGRLKPEAELCLLLSRYELDDQQVNRVGQLIQYQDFQWKHFLDIVYSHQVYPLAYRNLERIGVLIPKDVLLQLKGSYLINASRARRMEAESDSLLGLFTSSGIIVYPHKGPKLSRFLFGDPSARHSDDIDLIVDARNWEKAREVMDEADYAPVMSTEGMRHDHWHKALTFVRKGVPNAFPVELHWDFAPKYFDFDTSSLVSTVLSEAGRNQGEISRELLLILLSIHASKHDVFVLKWLGDLDRLIQLGIDWDKVGLLAKKYRAERATRMLLSLLSILYGTGIGLSIKRFSTLKVWTIPYMMPAPPLWVTGPAKLFVSDRLTVRLLWFFRKVAHVFVDPLPEDYSLPPLPRVFRWLYPFLRLHHRVKRMKTLRSASAINHLKQKSSEIRVGLRGHV